MTGGMKLKLSELRGHRVILDHGLCELSLHLPVTMDGLKSACSWRSMPAVNARTSSVVGYDPQNEQTGGLAPIPAEPSA